MLPALYLPSIVLHRGYTPLINTFLSVLFFHLNTHYMPIVSYANLKQPKNFSIARIYGGQTPVQQLEQEITHAGKTK